MAAHQALEVILDEDWEFRLKNLPEFATATGDHRYDNRMDDRSLNGYKKISDWAKQVLVRLDAWDMEYSSIALQQDLCSSRLLRHHCNCVYEGGKFQTYLMPLNRLEGPHTEMPQLIAYMKFETVNDYLIYLSRLKCIPGSLLQVTDLLKKGIETKVLPPAVGLESVGEQLAAVLKPLSPDDSDGKKSPLWRACPVGRDESMTKKLESEVSKVLTTDVRLAYESFRNFVVDTYIPAVKRIRGDSHACLDLPNGAELYASCLKFHIGATKTAQEVHDVGLEEVARITNEMKAACISCGMKPDDDLKTYLNNMNQDKRYIAATEEQLVAKYRDVCMGIFPNLPKLFSIKCMPRTPFAVIPTPAAQAEAAPGAYYLGGAGDGTRAGTFYINTSVLHERTMIQAESLSLHEAIPGHHTQTMLAAENQELPHFRRFMDDRRYSEAPGRYPIDGAFIEGWGLYSESIGKDLGCYTDPHQLVGRLSMEMFRSCRLVVDTGLHAFGWSVSRAKEFMKTHTAASEVDIDAEVKRYCTWPGQATGYKMGELEIWRLRHRFESALPEASVRDFHDIVLLQGSLPLCVIEEILEEYIKQALKVSTTVSEGGETKLTKQEAGGGGNSSMEAFMWGVGFGAAVAAVVVAKLVQKK